MDTSGFTVEEAAYLMGLSVEKIRKMIDRGELLTISATGKIHETEMYRFQHPWKRVFALDQRCTAQQNLVETLKDKIVEKSRGLRDTLIPEMKYLKEETQETVRSFSSDLRRLADEISELRESKADKLFKKKKK